MNLGPLTKHTCLECGASPPRHQLDCSNSPAYSFWNKFDSVSVARSIRLAAVQNVFDQGGITEEQARDILTRATTPGDNSTIYDDSDCLEVKE